MQRLANSTIIPRPGIMCSYLILQYFFQRRKGGWRYVMRTAMPTTRTTRTFAASVIRGEPLHASTILTCTYAIYILIAKLAAE